MHWIHSLELRNDKTRVAMEGWPWRVSSKLELHLSGRRLLHYYYLRLKIMAMWGRVILYPCFLGKNFQCKTRGKLKHTL